jgi:beta-lactamase class A
MPEINQRPYRSQYYYSSSKIKHNQAKSPKKGPRLLKKILVLIVIALVVIGIHMSLDHKNNPISAVSTSIKKVLKSPTPSPSATPGPSSQAIAAMSNSINGVINANSNIDFDVSLIDLNTGKQESYGQDQPMTAASVGKLITAGDFLNEVEKGSQSLTETVGGYSAEYELQQMIVVSDDTAWANLNNLLTYPQLQTYASTIGINDYNSVNNTFTAQDTAHLLELLYNNKLLNASDTQLLMGYLKQANYRQYVVPAIPAEDTIYHKIGLYTDNVNDATIITHGNQAFVLVIFTNGNGAYNWPARAQMMQQIAKAALLCYFDQT